MDDGLVSIDNNRAENQLRVVAVGRKIWLFAGSLGGAHRAAFLYSFVQSCKLVDVSALDCLKDVLLAWPPTRTPSSASSRRRAGSHLPRIHARLIARRLKQYGQLRGSFRPREAVIRLLAYSASRAAT